MAGKLPLGHGFIRITLILRAVIRLGNAGTGGGLYAFSRFILSESELFLSDWESVGMACDSKGLSICMASGKY